MCVTAEGSRWLTNKLKEKCEEVDRLKEEIAVLQETVDRLRGKREVQS